MGVAIYRREFEVDPSARGHHVVYRLNESNRCPGCGHAQWLVGRVTAECVFCGTAVALAEAQWSGSGPACRSPARRQPAPPRADRCGRAHAAAADRRLAAELRARQYLIRRSRRRGPAGASARIDRARPFEGGILVPATVKWVDGEQIGLAFTSPVLLDTAQD